MAEPKKRGLFGLPTPLVIGIGIAFALIFVLALAVGPIGQGLLDSFGVNLEFPAWMTVPQPLPHLPAPELFHIFGFPITNSMIGAWITVVFLVAISYVVTRRMKLVPGRLQALFEGLLGWMFDFCAGIAGNKNARRFFPVVCTIFLFVLFNAWLSLIPGFVSLEHKTYEAIPAGMHVVVDEAHEGELVLVSDDEHANTEEDHGAAPTVVEKDGEYYILDKEELVRGANTDINTPLAIAVISFIFVIYHGLRALGYGFVRQYLNFGPFFRSIGGIFKGKFNVMNIFSGGIDAFVGLLELLGLFIRNISFTFRLFGNMTAGEILLLIIAFLVPWVLAPIFYGLELLIGFVQALVFAGLTVVFVTMAVTPHGGESH